MVTISLLLTVKDEAASIGSTLASIQLQTRRPDELIIADGGSSDGTLARLHSFAEEEAVRGDGGIAVTVLAIPGCNISQGRNAAFAESQGEIVAITDAGVVLPADWLTNICEPLLTDSSLDVAAGFFHAAPQNAFEAALAAVTLPLAHEIDAAKFLPSSRSIAVRKSAFAAVGGYPEWLDYCEDLILDFRLKAQRARFEYLPAASVAYRPRTSLAAYGRQYFRYSRGDGKAGLWPRRHAIRYFTYLFLIPVLIALSLLTHPGFWVLLALGGWVYLGPLYRRLPTNLRRLPDLSLGNRLLAYGWIPVMRVWGDWAKMLGYPFGRYWRWRERPPAWR